jgi:hypothetical protein
MATRESYIELSKNTISLLELLRSRRLVLVRYGCCTSSNFNITNDAWIFRYHIVSWNVWPISFRIQNGLIYVVFLIVHVRTETKHSAMRFKHYWRNSSLAVISIRKSLTFAFLNNVDLSSTQYHIFLFSGFSVLSFDTQKIFQEICCSIKLHLKASTFVWLM